MQTYIICGRFLNIILILSDIQLLIKKLTSECERLIEECVLNFLHLH